MSTVVSFRVGDNGYSFIVKDSPKKVIAFIKKAWEEELALTLDEGDEYLHIPYSIIDSVPIGVIGIES